MRRVYGAPPTIEPNVDVDQNNEFNNEQVYENNHVELVNSPVVPKKSKRKSNILAFIFAICIIFVLARFVVISNLNNTTSSQDDAPAISTEDLSIYDFSADADSINTDTNFDEALSDDAIDEISVSKNIVKYTPEDYSDNTPYYVYNQIYVNEQAIYDVLYCGILNMDSEIELPTADATECNYILNCMLADHGDIFYLVGGSFEYLEDGSANVIYYPKYSMTKEERDSYQVQIDEKCNEWLSMIPVDADDYTKVKMCYEMLIMNVDYDESAVNNQNIISVFINGKTVCNGYASAMSYMLNKLGVECARVEGYGNNENHAWNLVKEDDEYYWVDVTWGNSLYSSNGDVKYINYDYLNITDDDLLMTHTIDVGYPIVKCTATKDNYYVHEGLYFDSFDASLSALSVLQNGTVCHIRYKNENDYAIALDRLFEQGEIYNYVSLKNSIGYISNDDMHSIVIAYY